MNKEFPKLQRDGNTAVLYSPGYGAGWSTWNSDEWRGLLSMHRDIASLVEAGDVVSAARVAEKLIADLAGDPEIYVCVLGADQLKIRWVPTGSQFQIDEYDGSESVQVIGENSYLNA